MKVVTQIIFFLFVSCTFSQEWKSNYADALQQANDESKPIVLVFSGSDWCGPCIKLDKAIWKSDTFISYSAENYVLYKADFPRKKSNQLLKKIAAKNAILADQFNSKGYFPLVVILNAKEDILGVVGYKNISAQDYISLLNSYIK